MKRIITKSLKIRLTLLYFVTVVICFSLIFYYVLDSFESQKLTEIEGKLISAKAQLEKEFSSYSSMADQHNFPAVINPVLDLANFSYLVIRNTKGEIIYSFNSDIAEQAEYNIQLNTLSFSEDKNHFRYASKIITDKPVGTIFIGYSLADYLLESAELERNVIHISLFVLIVGLIFIWFVVRRIMNPLYNLIDTAQKIGDGDFTRRAEIETNDELGYLATVFNNMVEKMFVVNYELEHINKELELRVEDRTVELIEAKEKAEETERLKSAFLAQMSHEIRTPINTIMNYISLVKEEMVPDASRDLLDCFKVIDSGSKRLVRTIDSVLNMSQFYSGTFDVHFEKVNLACDILEEIYSEYFPIAESKGLELILNKQTDEDEIVCDKYSVHQLFINLVENSIKYTNKGIISIGIYDKDDGHVNVVITDSGIGMSEEFMENLWKPFSQEETGYTRKYEGNGLGLALVKQYANVNYANVSAESIKNVGSKFIIEFEKSINVHQLEERFSSEEEYLKADPK